MRSILLTTVAAMAIATPALAADVNGGYAPPSGDPLYSSAPMVVGDLEMSLGHYTVDRDGEKSVDNFQGWARANVPVGDTWNILAEIGGSGFFNGVYPDGESFATVNTNAHVWADRGSLRYGVFGGASFGAYNALTYTSLGLEAEIDLGNAVIGGQGFYSWNGLEDCGGCDLNATGVSGWVDYYLTPNTKATGTLAWLHASDIICCSGTDVDDFAGSGRITHRFAGTPVNIFGEASLSSFEAGPSDGTTARFSGGFTVLIDGQGYTQQEFDRNAPFSFRHPLSSTLF